MAMLNNEAALKFAKEFTITAMEHNLIKVGNSASETANNVYEFYKTMYEKLSAKN